MFRAKRAHGSVAKTEEGFIKLHEIQTLDEEINPCCTCSLHHAATSNIHQFPYLLGDDHRSICLSGLLHHSSVSQMHSPPPCIPTGGAVTQTNKFANTIITCFPDTPRNSGGDAGETSACADCVIRERKLQSACSEEEDEKG